MQTATHNSNVVDQTGLKLASSSRLPYWPVLLFVMLGGLLLPVDVYLTHNLNAQHLPRLLKFTRDIVEMSEFFGNGVGVVYIVITVFVLDKSRRKLTWGLIVLLLLVSLSANGIKLLIGRNRPRDVELANVTPQQTWTGFLPYLNGAQESQSFPSAHTATAVCLAVVLGAIYPAGCWLFLFMAMMVGLQRVMFQAHYPSDVMGGAALGWLIASLGITQLNVFRHQLVSGQVKDVDIT